MKKIIFLLMMMVSVYISAQMDVEHWFAPIFDSSDDGQLDDDSGDYLYLSTDKTIPFEVIVYSENVEIHRVNISVGRPISLKITEGLVTTRNKNDVLYTSKKGLHIVGEKKFFANLRILRANHAEIINSKGLAALGETFYAGMANLTDNKDYYNFQTSIIATENNTKISVSGYPPGQLFSDGNTYPGGISITLQKGESYIISAPYSRAYQNGLVATKIQVTSGGPISVTSGNFTGTYVSGTTSTDILMDQSVPISRLGSDYIVAKGNGEMTTSPMNDLERVLVIATNPYNPTDIYVNGVFYKTLNAGEFDFVYSDSYKDIDGTLNFSMSIKSVGGDIYVYQLLSGLPTSKATGGMNLIPSLSCFLPNNIIELPELDEIGPRKGFNTKVNVISQSGANVFLNGKKLTGHPVPNNTDWELFVEQNVIGTVSITSDKASTAGIASGNANVGYGGYFAGFSSIPVIVKTGDCAKGQTLFVDDIYDDYFWEFSYDKITWNPLPDNAPEIQPASGDYGYYRCTVTKLACASKTTTEFKYLKCTDVGAPKAYTIGNCMSIVPIVPVFTNYPSLSISKATISQNPEGGYAYPDAAGNIHFEANGTTLDQVTFKYYFESYGDFPDSEEVTVTVNIAQIKLTNPPADVQCVNFDGEGSYNLKNDFELLNTDSTYVKYQYYSDSALKSEILGLDIENYMSKPDMKVYVVVTNIYGCDNRSKPAEISLKTFELPQINTIDVKGEASVTINATKGTAPYLYYVKKDGDLKFLPAPSDYSSSNILPIKEGKGIYTVYVKSADNCNPVTQIFAVIGISNVITPNDDGKNDVIDMSMLSYKLNPKFQIFNRNGTKVFEGNASNNFTWAGKINGNPLPTATYWYLLQWQDFDGAEPDIKTGWILLKNRNSD